MACTDEERESFRGRYDSLTASWIEKYQTEFELSREQAIARVKTSIAPDRDAYAEDICNNEEIRGIILKLKFLANKLGLPDV